MGALCSEGLKDDESYVGKCVRYLAKHLDWEDDTVDDPRFSLPVFRLSERLRTSVDFILRCVPYCPEIINQCPAHVKHAPEVLKALVHTCRVSATKIEDAETLLEAVKTDITALGVASHRLQGDAEVLKQAHSACECCLDAVPDGEQSDFFRCARAYVLGQKQVYSEELARNLGRQSPEVGAAMFAKQKKDMQAKLLEVAATLSIDQRGWMNFISS